MPLSICVFSFWYFPPFPLDSSQQSVCSLWGGVGQIGSIKLIYQLKTVHTAPRSHIVLKFFRSLCTLQSFTTWNHISSVPKFKFVFTKRLSLDCRKHQYYCAHWRKERARNLSELADLLLELEVLCLVFNNPVSDLHCKKEMCVSHACIYKKIHKNAYSLQKGMGLCQWCYSKATGVLRLSPASWTWHRGKSQ